MIAVITVLVLLACWPTSLALHEVWTSWDDMPYTHGYVIALICAWLVWRNGRGFVPADRAHRAPALVALLVTGLAWVFSVRAGVATVQWLLLPLLMLLSIWAAAGQATARRNLFPLAYLYFAMPVWGVVQSILLWGTVYVVRGLLTLAGVPAHFVGNSVQIPAGTFEIAGGCSGLHYTVVALAIAALMGELRDDDWRGRLKLLAIAGTLAVVTNWARVFIIILAGHFTHMQHYLVAQSHESFGWILFAVAMTAFFVLERRMPVGAARPRLPLRSPQRSPASAAFVVGVAGALAVVSALQWLSARPARAATVRITLPGWSESPSAGGWEPVVQRADAQRVTAYVSPRGQLVERREYQFLSQTHKKELGAYGNNYLGGMRALATRTESVASQPMVVHEVSDAQGVLWLVAAGYRVGGLQFASPLPAQIRYAALSLRNLRSEAASLTLLRTACMPDCRAAQAVLDSFLAGIHRGSTP
jgi:exosortase A